MKDFNKFFNVLKEIGYTYPEIKKLNLSPDIDAFVRTLEEESDKKGDTDPDTTDLKNAPQY